MKTNLKRFKQIIFIATLMLHIAPSFAQSKHRNAVVADKAPVSGQLKNFYEDTADANIKFVFPKGFKEIQAPDDEDFSFDYAMEMPGKDFEIWFKVKSLKKDWDSYKLNQNIPESRVQNPDSVYMKNATSEAISFTGEKDNFERTIPRSVLDRYNADAGKSYLLTLLDMAQTKHYKYALLITLQKNHTGTIMAVCFTNEKGPEFFKNVNKASNCLKFKNTASR